MRACAALPLFAPLLLVACTGSAVYVENATVLRRDYLAHRSPDTAETLIIPFEADDELRGFAREIAGATLSPRAKAIRIGAAIVTEVGGQGLTYESYRNLTAVEAFHERSGNCMAFTNLFVAMARAAGLPAVYVLVDRIDQFDEGEDHLVAMRHVCAGFYQDHTLRLVDFGEYDPSTYWDVRVLSDREAVARFHSNLGYDAYRDGDVDAALLQYRTALTISPGSPHVLNNLGLALRRSGDLDAARETLEAAVAADDQSLPALSNLASLYRDLGLEDDAAGIHARIEAVRSNSPYHLYVKGRLCLERGDFAEAARVLRLALLKERENALLYRELASAYDGMGEIEKSLKAFRRAQELD